MHLRAMNFNSTTTPAYLITALEYCKLSFYYLSPCDLDKVVIIQTFAYSFSFWFEHGLDQGNYLLMTGFKISISTYSCHFDANIKNTLNLSNVKSKVLSSSKFKICKFFQFLILGSSILGKKCMWYFSLSKSMLICKLLN